MIGLHLSGWLSEAALSRFLSDLPAGLSVLVTHPGEAIQGLARRYRWDFE